MDLANFKEIVSNIHENEITNNGLSKKLPNIKINFTKDNNNLGNNQIKEKKSIEDRIDSLSQKKESTIKTMNLIVLDDDNNILTKKYQLKINYIKNIENLPLDQDPYKINFRTLNDLSKQLLIKLKTNDSNDINHYKNIDQITKISFHNENLNKRLTDEDIFIQKNDNLICKLELSKNKNAQLDKDLLSNMIKVDKLFSTPNNIRNSISKKFPETKPHSSTNNIKYSPSKINRDYFNKDISINDHYIEERNSFFKKLKDNDRQNKMNKPQLDEDFLTKDYSNQNTRNKESLLNRSESDSYILTNRSFYNKIKPKNVEILIRDSEKKNIQRNQRNINYKFAPPENLNVIPNSLQSNLFYINKKIILN